MFSLCSLLGKVFSQGSQSAEVAELVDAHVSGACKIFLCGFDSRLQHLESPGNLTRAFFCLYFKQSAVILKSF